VCVCVCVCVCMYVFDTECIGICYNSFPFSLSIVYLIVMEWHCEVGSLHWNS
jgi:hypothetical protein